MLLVMRSTLPTLAAALCADARTLRRAVARGTVRCRRPGPRQLALSDGELAYLHGHWPTLEALSRALRTERGPGSAEDMRRLRWPSITLPA
jgi:hypothetical protein